MQIVSRDESVPSDFTLWYAIHCSIRHCHLSHSELGLPARQERLCLFRLLLSLNPWRHRHLCGFAPLCMRKCFVRLDFCFAVYGQASHWNSRSSSFDVLRFWTLNSKIIMVFSTLKMTTILLLLLQYLTDGDSC